jgi:dipeptidyl aminopeptidase/acylaminoacyl peptidase
MTNPLTAEKLWTIPRVGLPTTGGGRIVVPVTTPDLEANTTTSTLWQVFTDGAPPRRLTSAPASSPVLSPDGTMLAFVRAVDDRPQIHVLAMDGGEGQVVTDLPLGVTAAKWMPDGERLLVMAPLLEGHLTVEATAGERDRRNDQLHTARVIDRAVYRFWDHWLDDGQFPHLFLVEVASGQVRDLTPASARWFRWDFTGDTLDHVDVSPDGSTVAFVADRSEPPHGALRWSLQLLDVASGEEQSLTPGHEGHISHPRFSPDGSRLVYGRTNDPDFYAERVRLVDHRLESGSITELAPDWDRSPSAWWFDGDDLVLVAEDDARQPVWRLGSDGITEVARDGTLAGVGVVAPGRYVAAHSTLTAPPELALVADGVVTRLTSFTEVVGFDPPSVDEVRYTGADGDEVHLWVVTPPGGLETPGPLVHLIHGGPHAVNTDGWQWRWNAAVLAGTDRRVALVDFHGSTSWGQDWAASIRGEWGRMPAADIEAATERLIADGLADPERLAITGGSYGGYLVSWLIGQTDRYACAVAHAAVTDLPNMYASDRVAGRADAFGAEAWADLDRVNRWSPAAHAAGYATPTLVIHGERDFRVPVGQGLELYGVLRSKGVEARLVYYPDEGHWILSPANSIHWYGQVTEWLDRYLTYGGAPVGAPTGAHSGPSPR